MNSSPLNTLSASTLALLRKHNLLKQLVSAEVIKNAVEGIEIPEDHQKELLDAYCKQRGIKSRESLETHLKQICISEPDLYWNICLNKRINLHSIEQYKHKAEARFLERKDQLDRVVYSLLRQRDPLLARELFLQIAGNEATFADLASKHSEGPERKSQGCIGPVPLTQAHPALAEKLRTNPTGKLMEPFAIGEWWLIARLERYEPARFDQSVAEQMALELFQEWVEEESTAKLRALSSSTTESPE
tara:strand:- start:852 stop:1589 length:738 start_codon:yes stop_codon:yes gene_type:complete